MRDLRIRTPSRVRLAQLLREQESAFVALFDGAELLAGELADSLVAPDVASTAAVAAMHGARRAREDASPEVLAREFADLYGAVSRRLAAADLLEGAAVWALHELLHRQFGSSVVAFVREREAQLLAMVAHDISNPLMSVCLCRDYLAGVLHGSPEHHAVRDTLTHATQQLQELTRELQDVADLRVAPSHLAGEPIEAVELVAEAVARLEPVAAARGIPIERALQIGRATLLGERERLARALVGVLQCAFRAASPGCVVAIHGSVERAAVLLRVRVSGPEVAGATNGRKRTSTPMYVIRCIVEAHGGRLWLEPAAAGQRSALALSLPLADGLRECEV